MGRRAADLTTPVPVLGVPALVGVRGWKTTGGDRTRGALLQTWGIHCSVGVQTSPAISRPPTQHTVQLTDTLSTSSDNITQTSNSYITKETEYKEILLVTKSDKEKRAILKLKTGESKTKKEVTFKALGGEASKDVACSQRNISGTFCYARAIKTNPHIAGNANNIRPKLKSGARYTNGSVVDSEAIGGISVESDEAETVKSATLHGRDQTRQQGHYAEQSGKMPLLPAARPFVMPQKTCSNCGGRQSVIGTATLGEKSPTDDACPLKSVLTSLSAPMHLDTSHIDRNRNLKPTQHQISERTTNRDIRTHTAVKPQMLHLNEEVSFRKHPGCPVHSRRNLVTLSHAHEAGDATSTQPTTILHAKSITVTKATIETRQADASLKSFAKLPQGSKIPRPTSLTLTPQMATATKPNKPHSHTYPRPIKTSQHDSSQYNVPQNVCVSVHATTENTLSPPSHSYNKGTGPRNVSNTNTHKTTTTFNTATAKVNAQHETMHSMHKTQLNTATNTTDSPQLTLKCPSSSKASDPIHISERTAVASPSSLSCTSALKPQVKLFSKVKVSSTTLPTFAKIPQHKSTPQLSTIVPQSSLNHIVTSDQTTQTSTKHNAKFVATQIHLIQPHSSNSEPTLYITTPSVITTLNATKSPDSRAKLPSSTALSSTSTPYGAMYKNTALRNSTTTQKNSPATVSSSPATLTENQTNVCVSSRALLQSANRTQQELSRNAKVIRTQTSEESGVSNRGNNTKTASPALSEPLGVSKNPNRGSGEKVHNPKSTMNLNTKSYTDKNKFSGNLINELVVHEQQDHGNSNISQVTNLQNYISLIKSGSSCLQGCINTEQQRLAHYQGYTETEHKGYCGPCPPVKTAQETDSKTEQFALGKSARHANIKLKSNADKQTHPNYSSSSATAQINCINSSPANSCAHVDCITQSLMHQKCGSQLSSPPQAHTGPELCFSTPAPFKNEGELYTYKGPECNSILPSSAMHLASLPRLQSCDPEAIVRADSKCSPAPPQPCPEDTSLAHSHPAGAALLLPPSPQCSKSAALQQRLETVEASLAANKDRITTLLNIIHDLETCHTPTSG